MTKKRREKLLPTVLGILRSQAWGFHRRYPNITFDEFMSEAYIGFMQACDKFDPEKHSKFSTWCQTKVSCHIKTYLHKRFSDRLSFVEEIKDEMLPPVPPAAFRNSLSEQTRGLSGEARRLIQRLIETPQVDPKPRQLLREALEEMGFEGFDSVHQQIITHEIKSCLAS